MSIPHTVRPTGWDHNPTTNAANVSKLGAVKHGRNVSSTWDTDPGKALPGASADTLSTELQGRRCSTHIHLKINATRRTPAAGHTARRPVADRARADGNPTRLPAKVRKSSHDLGPTAGPAAA